MRTAPPGMQSEMARRLQKLLGGFSNARSIVARYNQIKDDPDLKINAACSSYSTGGEKLYK